MPAEPAAPRAVFVAPALPDLETAPPKRLQTPFTTVNLKIAPTPVMSPRAGNAAQHPRPSLGDMRLEVDEEALRKAFERPIAHSAAVVCRFCKGPLDLDGDFCEQCGAPVEEAAPPGAVKPKPQPAAPPAPPAETPAAPPPQPAETVPPAPSFAGSPTGNHPSAAPTTDQIAGSSTGQHSRAMPPAPARSAMQLDSTHHAPTQTPAPVVPPPPPAEEHPAGLMGRLKGLFKKG